MMAMSDTSMEPGAAAEADAPDSPAGGQGASDYARVRRALAYLTESWRDQPPLEDVAAHVGLSPAHFHRLFARWAGLSPKEFVQAVTLDHARAMLRETASVLDAAYAVGLSGGGRLHDLFVAHEAMTPGEYKRGGAGLEIAWGFHDSPFGRALVMATARGVAGLAFADGADEERGVLADMTARWPAAAYIHDPARTGPYAARIFTPGRWQASDPLRVVLIGTGFEVRVWRALMRVPPGAAVSYSGLAERVGAPRAARAVGSAVGRNPVAFVVPCHRVLRKDGGLGGYHWGVTRKRAIIGWEAGRLAGR